MIKAASFFLGVAIASQVLPVVQSGSWIQMIVIASTIAGATWRVNSQLKKIHEKTFLISVEHEMLIGDYCERKNMRPRDLPTRQARGMGA